MVMPCRRLFLTVGAVIACVVVALGLLAMLPAKPGVTKVRFDSVKNGMSYDEVEALFGEPTRTFVKEWGTVQIWNHSDGSAMLMFDEESRVTFTSGSFVADERSSAERLLDWIPWRKSTRPKPIQF